MYGSLSVFHTSRRCRGKKTVPAERQQLLPGVHHINKYTNTPKAQTHTRSVMLRFLDWQILSEGWGGEKKRKGKRVYLLTGRLCISGFARLNAERQLINCRIRSGSKPPNFTSYYIELGLLWSSSVVRAVTPGTTRYFPPALSSSCFFFFFFERLSFQIIHQAKPGQSDGRRELREC